MQKSEPSEHEEKILRITKLITNDFIKDRLIYHHTVAYLLQNIFQDKLVHVSDINNTDIWYSYSPENHRWIRIHNFYRLCDTEFSVALFNLSIRYTFTNYYDTITEAIAHLKSVISDPLFFFDLKTLLIEKFHNPNFQYLKNTHLVLSCNNGIYDLNKLELRSSNVRDYVTLSTRINYYVPHQNEIDGLFVFLSSLFTTPTNMNLFIKHLTKALYSGIIIKQDDISKSFMLHRNENGLEPLILRYQSGLSMKIIRKLISYSLGDYFAKFSSSDGKYSKDIFRNNDRTDTRSLRTMLKTSDIKEFIENKKVVSLKFVENLATDARIMQAAYGLNTKCILEISDFEYNVRRKNLDILTREKFNKYSVIDILPTSKERIDLERKEKVIDGKSSMLVKFTIGSATETYLRSMAPIFLHLILDCKRKV